MMTPEVEEIALYSRSDQVDPDLWRKLDLAEPGQVTLRCGARFEGGRYRVEMIGREYSLDPGQRTVLGPDSQPARFQEALALLIYLTTTGPGGLAGARMAPRRLVGGDLFFTKSHALATEDLAAKLNLPAEEFLAIGQRLGGRLISQDPAAWLILALPQIPMEAVFFAGNEEFAPCIQLLVDAAADRYLDLGTLWALINILARRIKEAAVP